MRLTADMIARSPAFFNACREREIDLRGNKIAVIENLAATQNQFDSIDLSDNEIRKLESMARLPRVTMLLLSNNRISRVDENVGQAFPKLEHLVLTNNHFATLTKHRGELLVCFGHQHEQVRPVELQRRLGQPVRWHERERE